MNNTVSRIIVAEPAAGQQVKTNTPDDGKFKEMLSEAASAATESTGTKAAKTEPQDQEQEQLTGQTEQDVQDIQDTQDVQDVQEYAQQAAAAMQMQIMNPIITNMPHMEIPEEIAAEEAVAEETAETQTIQTQSANSVPEESQAQTGVMPMQVQNASNQAAQGKDEDGAKTQDRAARENTARHSSPQESEESFQARMTQKPTQTVHNESQPKTERTALTEEEASVITEAKVTRPTHQFVQMHNLRHRMQAGETQEKFDGMMAKASKELNPDTVEAEPEGSEEPTLEKQFILGEEKQESGKQAATPNDQSKPESKPQEEFKSTAQATAQKMVKPNVTDQKPQQEISEADETLLGITPQKQPEPVHEVIRNEPVQQPQQSQPTDQTEQIRTLVVKNLETQRTEFQMQLQPEELGKINVKMVLEGGKLSVEIMALNPKSAEMLAKQADALAMSLKAGGIETATVSVVTASENTSSHMNGEFDLNNFQNRFQNEDHTDGRQDRTEGAKASGEQIGEGGQNDPEEVKAPQRILNYSV